MIKGLNNKLNTEIQKFQFNMVFTLKVDVQSGLIYMS